MKPSINKLIRTAKTSAHDKYRHATLIMKGSRLLSAASNKNHRHSEVRAIIEYINGVFFSTKDLSGATLINIRLNKNGEFGMSKPCEKCMNAWILNSGIRTIIYTNEQGIFVTEKIR